jgi:chorismate mutase
MPIRGIRGAVPVKDNTKASIAAATRRLIRRLSAENRFDLDDVAGLILTATPDLTADFPASIARSEGWTRVPLLCAQEIGVPGSMPRVIRALLFVNTDLPQRAVRHVYIGATTKLRPDLAGKKSR